MPEEEEPRITQRTQINAKSSERRGVSPPALAENHRRVDAAPFARTMIQCLAVFDRRSLRDLRFFFAQPQT
ncbi:hypothetical protein J8F10_35920 [Gemmata sp. G18]|uniref:Uncharacterized protein n=1 Tax=Gemmata palustris TaxID=2822762 RepID=A0ABS5C6C0_9BACT|nr:hypothetical protein [Gemmata palustris]MBP3960643.1 hypothetical protein [Gemmata palustris]